MSHDRTHTPVAEDVAAWFVPRPDVRLGLTVVLGALGAWLRPITGDLRSLFPPAYVHGWEAPVWTAAALAGVIWLRRVERARGPQGSALFLGLAMALSLLMPLQDGKHPSLQARLIALAPLLLTLGAAASQFRQPSDRPWWVCLLRGPAIGLAAPLLLFASRSGAGRFPPFHVPRLSRLLFSLFLYAMALGSAPAMFGAWGCALLSFSVWSRVGCAWLFLLSPWPQYPHLPTTSQSLDRYILSSMGLVLLPVITLHLLAVQNQHVFTTVILYALLMLCLTGTGIAWLLLLCPWPRFPGLPKLGALPDALKIGSWNACALVILALTQLVWYARFAGQVLLSGKAFTYRFDLGWVGWTLDQSTIHSGFWRLTTLVAMVLPSVAIARWLCKHQTRWGYWGFAIPTTALCLCSLGLLAVNISGLLQYIHAMGLTPMRVYGLIYGLALCIIVLGFACWAVGLPQKEVCSASTQKG